MRGRSGILLTLLCASAALLLAACGSGESATPDGPSDSSPWRAVPASPLSPRAGALGLWTGSEVLLIGGSDAAPCPPSASCLPPDVPPLADGAAFDPQTGTWRRIADSPVPFEWAQAVVIRKTAYLWIPGSPGRPNADSAFLTYHVRQDRWQELPLPANSDRFGGIVQAGDGIVAYAGTDEQGEQPDLVFDPAMGAWSELQPDPLSPSFDRSMAWSGEELLLFDHELVPNPGSEKPSVTRAAALDLESGSWRRLPDSEILASGPWVTDDARLINPMLGSADGGDTNNWGRNYPYGGILDPQAVAGQRYPTHPTVRKTSQAASSPNPSAITSATAAGSSTQPPIHGFRCRRSPTMSSSPTGPSSQPAPTCLFSVARVGRPRASMPHSSTMRGPGRRERVPTLSSASGLQASRASGERLPPVRV